MANRFHAVHIVQQQLALQEYYSNVECSNNISSSSVTLPFTGIDYWLLLSIHLKLCILFNINQITFLFQTLQVDYSNAT